MPRAYAHEFSNSTFKKCLVRKAVRLSALHGIWCRALTLGQQGREQQRQFASQAVHTQVAVIITAVVTDLEREILAALQKLLFSTKDPGNLNMLPVWICLWLLILTYRETVHSWYSEKHQREGLPQLARQMYDMFISIYSTIFGPSSPMTATGSRTESSWATSRIWWRAWAR